MCTEKDYKAESPLTTSEMDKTTAIVLKLIKD
jgi:hypothetical protein